MAPTPSTSSRVRALIQWLGLSIIIILSFHVISTLLLAVMGLAPGSENWPLLLTFTGVLAVSGIAVGLQSYLPQQPLQQIAGTVSGVASGAILGFFTGGQLGGQQAFWGAIGLAIGCLFLGALAGWAYSQKASAAKCFVGSAIALMSGLCAYGLAFGLGAWSWMAIDTGRIGLAIGLFLLTCLYLLCTRRAFAVFSQYWKL